MCGGMFGVPFDRSRLNDVIALCACPVNTLPSLLTKSYDVFYVIKGFLANCASDFVIHFRILDGLKNN